VTARTEFLGVGEVLRKMLVPRREEVMGE